MCQLTNFKNRIRSTGKSNSDFEMPRKKPFSNKQKKKQLQEKREKKRGVGLGMF